MMLRFVLRRLLLAIPALFGLLALTFILLRVVPADPAAALAGDNATPAQIAAIRIAYGFDRPLWEQFLIYFRQVLSGDLGMSIWSNRPVALDVAQRLPATIELTIAALFIATIIGVPVGAAAGVYHNSPLDHLVRVTTVGGLALASFWVAIMLQMIFALDLNLLPLRGRLTTGIPAPPTVTGMYTIDALLSGQFATFRNAVWHMTLPAVTLSLGGLATIARFTRAGVLETMQKDFVAYGTAVGYRRWRLVSRYVLRNSLVATVTQIGLLFGALISSAVAVEAIFDWPGIGSYAVQAILSSDFKAILAVTLVIGVIYAVVNILVDLVHAWLDPRVAETL